MMRYMVLATDYDSTLAVHGVVAPSTLEAMEAVKRSGRRLVLVTGRQVEDLITVFPHIRLFDRVVGENGAILYHPGTEEIRPLAKEPPPELEAELRKAKVKPLSRGHVILATSSNQENKVLKVLHLLGLEYQLIFNKGALMLLPPGTNKAAGLRKALKELRLSPRNMVGVGDAENDFSFLSMCECSVSVSDAIPMLKRETDFVTQGGEGEGAREIAELLVRNDLRDLTPKLERHDLLLGTRDDGTTVNIPPHGGNILLAGTSGGGKSSLASAFAERLTEAKYQFCIFDPEGDYRSLPKVLSLGDSRHIPSVEEALDVLSSPSLNCAVNLLGMSLQERPAFFQELLQRLLEMRAVFGRPHWIIIDEAHHLLPSDWNPAWIGGLKKPSGLLLITVHPEHLHSSAIEWTDLVLALGENPQETLHSFGKKSGTSPGKLPDGGSHPGQALAWRPGEKTGAFFFHHIQSHMERRRHIRKYAEGELGMDKSFYFRGPESRLNLRAQNLLIFLQLADGVDDETWMFHLLQGDVAKWFREAIKDEGMAGEVESISSDNSLTPAQSRSRIRGIVEGHYTASV